MNRKEGLLLLGVLIALLCVPAAVSAAGGGSSDPYYINVSLDDPKEYRNLTIKTIDALDPLDVSTTSVTLINTEPGDLKAIEGPLLGDITRKFDPSSGHYDGAYITVIGDKTVNGESIPRQQHIYVKETIPSFTVKVPTERGNVLLIKCPENIDPEASFTDIFNAAEKVGYLFTDNGIIYVNETGITAHGAINGSDYDKDNLTYTLIKNEVNLGSFTTDSNLVRGMMEASPYTRPTAGEYLLTAVKYDSSSNTMHVLAAMPVLILDKDTKVTWSGDKPYYQDQNEDVTVSFGNGVTVNKIAYALVKKDPTYGLKVEVNTTKLAEQPVPTSPVAAISILKSIIAEEDSPAKYTLTCGTDTPTPNVTYNTDTCLAIVEGYGCAGANNASSSVSIAASTLKKLNPGTYYLYALGMENQKVTAIDQTSIEIKATTPPTPRPPSGGGGGRGGTTYTSYTGTGSLLVGSSGTVLQPIRVSAEDGVGRLLIPLGVKALDADGNPLSEVTITPVSSYELPWVPTWASYKFAGYAYDAKPDGATFDPAISLVFEIPEDVWNTLDPDNNKLMVKWYNEETELWEDVPTTVSTSARSVTAEVTHFSIFALFSEELVTTPIETPPTPETPTTPETPVTPPAEEFPWTYVVIAIVIILVIAVGVYYYTRKP